MKKNGFSARFAVLASVAALVAGCETARSGYSRGYMNPNDDVFGKPPRTGYTQKSLALVIEIGRAHV